MTDFQSAYEEHVFGVYGFFAYRVRSRDDAEDLTQLTFERALRAWGRYDPARSSSGVWLLAIARNLLIDHYRADRSSRHAQLEEMGRAEPATTEPDPDLGLGPELAQALATLPLRDREVLALRFGGDLDGPQIAAMTGMTLANVQQILSRSLRKMRGILEEEDERSP